MWGGACQAPSTCQGAHSVLNLDTCVDAGSEDHWSQQMRTGPPPPSLAAFPVWGVGWGDGGGRVKRWEEGTGFLRRL